MDHEVEEEEVVCVCPGSLGSGGGGGGGVCMCIRRGPRMRGRGLRRDFAKMVVRGFKRGKGRGGYFLHGKGG